MHPGARSPAGMRLVNTSLVLDLLRHKGPLSRADLARETGLTRSTVSHIVSQLLQEQMVREIGSRPGTLGRRPILVAYNPDGGVVVGLDIGGTNIHCGVANLSGEVILRRRIPTFRATTAAEFIYRLAEALQALLAALSSGSGELKAVGVATPGIVDAENGVVLGASPNLPQWHDLPLSRMLGRHLEVPVLVENDVNAALLGEHRYGRARNRRNLAFVAVSTGIGGALMLNGQLYRGTRGAAGEIGYWLMGRRHIHRDWQPHGCLEALCSGGALARRASRLAGDDTSAAEVFAAARAGLPEAQRLVRAVAEYLGMAVANLASLLDLETVVLGGGVMLSAQQLLEPVQDIVRRQSPVPLEVVTSGLGDEAGMLGAVELALRHFIPDARLTVGEEG